MVPKGELDQGHEIVGRVAKVGSAVTKSKPGDLAGVGCRVDSDHTCPHCQAGLEQFCPNQTLTYDVKYRFSIDMASLKSQ